MGFPVEGSKVLYEAGLILLRLALSSTRPRYPVDARRAKLAANPDISQPAHSPLASHKPVVTEPQVDYGEAPGRLAGSLSLRCGATPPLRRPDENHGEVLHVPIGGEPNA